MPGSGALTVLSLASLGLGCALAGLARRRRSHAAALERCAGALLVAGLALLGAALQRAGAVR